MWGAEGERLEQQRLAARSQYAADLQRQMEDQYTRKDNPFRETAAKQLLRIPSEASPQQQQTFSTPTQHQQAAPTWDPGRDASGYAQRQPDRKLEAKLKDLQNSVDRIITVDIPMRVKPQEEAISALFTKVDQIGTQNKDAIQSVREKVTDLSFNVNNLTQKTNDQGEKIRNAIMEMKGDASRARDVCDAMTGKMGQLEARIAQVEDLVRSLVTRQQQIEQNMNEQYSQMSNALQTVQKNVNSANRHVMGQIEQLNRETVASVTRMNQALQDTGVAFNESISALAREAKDSFNIVRSECDEEIEALKQQLDSSTDEINQSFTALQSEVVQTFSTFKGILESDMQTLEHSLAQEILARKEGDKRVEDSQKTLLVGVNTQMAGISANVTRIEKDIPQKVEMTCNTYFEKWKGDLSAYLKDSLDTITECKVLVDSNTEKVGQLSKEQKELEHAVKEFGTRLENQAGSFGNQLSAVSIELTRSINVQADTIRKEFTTESDAIRKELNTQNDAIRKELNTQTDTMRKEFNTQNDDIRKDLNTQTDTMRKEFGTQNEKLQRSLKSQNDNFEPRITKLENRYQKQKQQAQQKQADTTEDINTRVDRLEDICGDDPIPPQIQKINDKLARSKAKIAPLIGIDARLDRLERDSERNSTVIERIVRLETVQGMLKDQPVVNPPREVRVLEAPPVTEEEEEVEEKPKPTPVVEEKPKPAPVVEEKPKPAPAVKEKPKKELPVEEETEAEPIEEETEAEPIEEETESEPIEEEPVARKEVPKAVAAPPKTDSEKKYIFEDYPDEVGIPDVCDPVEPVDPNPPVKRKKRRVDNTPADFGVPSVAVVEHRVEEEDEYEDDDVPPVESLEIVEGESVDLPPVNPRPGEFRLLVAEPRAVNGKGRQLALPGKVLPFIYKPPVTTGSGQPARPKNVRPVKPVKPTPPVSQRRNQNQKRPAGK